MTSEQALKRLAEGNARHVANKPLQTSITADLRLDLFKNGQKPYAAIVSCSDSRAPAELIFDAGPGELFIIRTAGNVVGALELGSLELAVSLFKAPLILVMGHNDCGAVRAAVNGGEFTESIEAILKEIRSGIEIVQGKSYEVYEEENIRHTLSRIAANPTVSKAVSDGSVRLVAASFSLETGAVTFLD